jgi:hypothetical protein
MKRLYSLATLMLLTTSAHAGTMLGQGEIALPDSPTPIANLLW